MATSALTILDIILSERNRSLVLCDFIHRRTCRRAVTLENCLNLKFYLPFKLSNKTLYQRQQSPMRTRHRILDLSIPSQSTDVIHTTPRPANVRFRFITAEVGCILRVLAYLFTSWYVSTSLRIRVLIFVCLDSRPIFGIKSLIMIPAKQTWF